MLSVKCICVACNSGMYNVMVKNRKVFFSGSNIILILTNILVGILPEIDKESYHPSPGGF